MSEETSKFESVELGSNPTAETHVVKKWDAKSPITEEINEFLIVFKPKEL